MELFWPSLRIIGKKGGGPPASLLLSKWLMCLPPVMGKGAIRLRHPVRIFLLLYCRAPVIGRIDQFSSQFLLHRLLPTPTRRFDQPAHAERQSSLGPHFDWYLIGRAPDATGPHFDSRSSVLDRSFENCQGIFLRLTRHESQGSVENRLRHALLAPTHDRVDELSHQLVPIFRVRQYFSFSDFPFARHTTLLWFFRSILGTSLSPLLNSDRIQSASNNVVANAGKIFD